MSPSRSVLDHWLTSSWAISRSCLEFMSTAVLPTPEDAALLGPSSASSSCSLSALLGCPWAPGEKDKWVIPMSHLWMTPLTCSALWSGSALRFYSALSFTHNTLQMGKQSHGVQDHLARVWGRWSQNPGKTIQAPWCLAGCTSVLERRSEAHTEWGTDCPNLLARIQHKNWPWGCFLANRVLPKNKAQAKRVVASAMKWSTKFAF